jgi:hypothetical protein
MRDDLERDGVRFAPVEVAREFSIEHVGRVLHADFDVNRVFGHHSKFRKLISADPPVAEYGVPRSDIPRMFGEDRILRMLETHGIQIRWPAEPLPGAP